VRLALGAAQIGLKYGIANSSGQMTFEEARNVLNFAAQAGIDTLDTAVAYGNSEEQLGLLGVQNWKIVSKLPPLPSSIDDVDGWLINQLHESLRRLGVDRLNGILLHKPSDLLGAHGAGYVQALRRVRDSGLVNSIGYSIYSPDELGALCRLLLPDLVQAPFNIIDRRLVSSGWMVKLVEKGIRIHTRSVFLQGLLLMPPESRPKWFNRWQDLWQTWSESCSKSGKSTLSLSLQYVLSHPDIERVIVGVDSVTQLSEIISAAFEPNVNSFPQIESHDLELLEPSRWKIK
jgi:aryl-alcohol dehydrogenase-like predicted oxidoreductase